MKKMLMGLVNFMYLNDDGKVEYDDDKNAVLSVLKSVFEIGLCLGVCFCIFMIPLYIRF